MKYLFCLFFTIVFLGVNAQYKLTGNYRFDTVKISLDTMDVNFKTHKNGYVVGLVKMLEERFDAGNVHNVAWVRSPGPLYDFKKRPFRKSIRDIIR